MKKSKSDFKINFISWFIIVTGTLLLVNVLLLDLRGTTFFSKKEFKSLTGVAITSDTTYPTRGLIYDSDGNILAQDVTIYKIIFILSKDHQKYATDSKGNSVLVDDYVKDPATTAREVAKIIGADESYIYERLCLEGYYQVEIGTAGKSLTFSQKEQIEALNLPGITFESSIARYYPYKTMAAHLIGYVESQQTESGAYHLVGISGIEGILDDKLTGKEGYKEYYTDAYGNVLAGGEIADEDSINGYNVTLTLNSVIQQAVDDCLAGVMKLNENVEKTWCIVMDAKDGAILGYDSYPSFDANTMEIEDYNDYCATLPYEPGSTFKTVIYSLAIDKGVFNKDLTFDCTNFYIGTTPSGKIIRSRVKSDLVIRNYGNYQYASPTFYQAYCDSYNVGCAVLIEQFVDQYEFMDYVQECLFTTPVGVYGIDEGEFTGSYDWSSAQGLLNTTFGQGISVSALQLLRFYSAFSNGGVMIKPYVVKSITDSETGVVIYEGQREEVKRIVKEESVAEMLYLMEGVVNSGISDTSAKYQIPGVKVGGKSGTAEVALPTGGYGNLTIHSMMLGMPIDDPQVWIYIAYQDWNPRTAQYMKLVNTLERVVAATLGLTDTSSQKEETQSKPIIKDLENFSNHTVAYVKPKVNELELTLVLIGNGDTVVGQYPAAGSSLVAGQKIMILTDGSSITMPNMKGWSRKDVTAFWDLTGIAIQIDGYGFVTSQSIEPGASIDKTMTIELTLE